MSYTLLQLRQELARTIDSLVQGTASGGTTTTLIDTSLLDSGQWADDHFNGADLYVTSTTDSAAPEGENRYVTDFDSATGTLTVGKAFTAAPDAGDAFDIYLNYSKAELDQALMLAVRDQRFYASLSLSGSIAEYALTGITGLHDAGQVRAVALRQTTDTDSAFVTVESWRVWDNGGVLTIEFDTNAIDATTTARIEYEGRFTQMGSGTSYDDTATVGGDLWMHILRAQSYLYRLRMQSASGPDRDWYASLYRESMERLTKDEREARIRPTRAKLHTWGRNRESGRYQSSRWWL